jgi:hypothetical protein
VVVVVVVVFVRPVRQSNAPMQYCRHDRDDAQRDVDALRCARTADQCRTLASVRRDHASMCHARTRYDVTFSSSARSYNKRTVSCAS